MSLTIALAPIQSQIGKQALWTGVTSDWGDFGLGWLPSAVVGGTLGSERFGRQAASGTLSRFPSEVVGPREDTALLVTERVVIDRFGKGISGEAVSGAGSGGSHVGRFRGAAICPGCCRAGLLAAKVKRARNAVSRLRLARNRDTVAPL